MAPFGILHVAQAGGAPNWVVPLVGCDRRESRPRGVWGGAERTPPPTEPGGCRGARPWLRSPERGGSPGEVECHVRNRESQRGGVGAFRDDVTPQTVHLEYAGSYL